MKTSAVFLVALIAICADLYFSTPAEAGNNAQNEQAETTDLQNLSINKPWWVVSSKELHLPATVAHMSSFDRDIEKAILLHRIEPARLGISAESWRSPYCVQWTDGCTRCERDDVQDDPQCASVKPPDEGRSCPMIQQRHVECERANMPMLTSLCKKYKIFNRQEKVLRSCTKEQGCVAAEAIDQLRTVPIPKIENGLERWPPNGQSHADLWRDDILHPEHYTSGLTITCAEPTIGKANLPTTRDTIPTDPDQPLSPGAMPPWSMAKQYGAPTEIYYTNAYSHFMSVNIDIQRELLRHRVEPDRFVHASDWHSPYCLTWDDGCTKCSRNEINGKIECFPIELPPADRCTAHFIECTKSEMSATLKYCPSIVTYSPEDFRLQYCNKYDGCQPSQAFNKVENIDVAAERRKSWPNFPKSLMTLSRNKNTICFIP